MHVALCKLITLDLENFLIKQLLPPSVQKVANLIFYYNMYGTPLCSVCVFVINVIKILNKVFIFSIQRSWTETMH